MKMVKLGDRSEDVRTVQHTLNNFPGATKLVEDGSFGSATLAAVKAFQTRALLVPDGIVGPKTSAALMIGYIGVKAGNPPVRLL